MESISSTHDWYFSYKILSLKNKNFCKVALTDNVEIDQISDNIIGHPAQSEEYSEKQ